MTDWLSRELLIPGDHPSAEGHFPGDPIVPGALLLDAAVAAIAGEVGDGRFVIPSAKFLRPVRHGAPLVLRWRPLGAGLFRFECCSAQEVALTGTLRHTQGAA